MFEKHIEKISLLLNDQPNTIGLSPILQRSLNTFCKTLPKTNPLVVSKYITTKHRLKTALQKYDHWAPPAKTAFIDRVALYVLWRAVVEQYVGPSLGVSKATHDLCKRCPPIGLTISTNGQVLPFLSKYTCKHYLCPACRMRRTLAIWNKFQNSLEFAPGVDLDLLHFQVTRTFAFTGLGSGDFKLDVLQKLIKQFKSLLWAYGGVWSLGLTSEGYEVTLTAKCAAICPPLPKRKLTRIREFTTGANYVCALAGDDMTIKTHKQSVKYDSAKVEQLFAKTLNTAVWPTSFMLNYTSPVATLFAAHLETTFSKQKTLGFFGPCDTMRKRLKSNA